MKKIYLFLMASLFVLPAHGQTVLQVASKIVQKTAKWNNGDRLRITSEQAEIEVKPGSNSKIAVWAELSSKHTHADSAKADLGKWTFEVNTVGDEIQVNALINTKNGTQVPASNLKARIIVQVPSDCPVNLSNKMGKVKINNLRSALSLQGEFCSFQVSNIGGNIWLDSKYGSLEAKSISGKIALKTNRTDLLLSELRSDCFVSSEYGKITVETNASTKNLAIKGAKSEVILRLKPDAEHNIHLKSEYGELVAPQSFDTSNSSENTRIANLKLSEKLPFVSIETTFGRISVEQNYY